MEANINNIKINIEDFNKLEKDHSIIKIMMIDEEEVLQKAIDNLPKEVYDKYTVVRSAPYFLEFLNKKVNKGVCVEMLASIWNNIRQVITMETQNDFHMMNVQVWVLLLGNAFEKLGREIILQIQMKIDGVAKAIEHLFK